MSGSPYARPNYSGRKRIITPKVTKKVVKKLATFLFFLIFAIHPTIIFQQTRFTGGLWFFNSFVKSLN